MLTDLKPENLLVAVEPSAASGPVLKLLDFGAAAGGVKAPSPTPTGTTGYRAPELFAGGRQGPPSDVYALGVIVYEMLHGLPPFLGDSDLETQALQGGDLARALADANRSLPAEISSILLQMLARQPEKRPPITEVAARLEYSGRAQRNAPGGPPDRPHAPVQPNGSRAPTEFTCPFPGLHSFDERLSHFFFGREADTRLALQQIGYTALGFKKWLQIEGPSGAGKSSLVHAGIVPAVRAGALDGGPLFWEIALLQPGNAPLARLAEELSGTALSRSGLGVEHIAQQLRSDPASLSAMLRRSLLPGQGLLLVVDQLEELFILAQDEKDSILALDRSLSAALADPAVPLFLLTTIRSDFIDRFAVTPNLARQLNQASRYYLQPLGTDELLRAMLYPAELCNLRFSEGLPEQIAADAGQAEAGLPLVAHILRELWMQRQDGTLTRAAYERLGGVGGALARSADELLASLPLTSRQAARSLLLELVRPSRDGGATRRVRTRQEVVRAAGGGEEALRALAYPSGSHAGSFEHKDAPAIRLVVIRSDDSAPPERHRVTLAHDALLQHWDTLRAWVRADKQMLERRDDIDAAARSWEASGAPSAGLPGGAYMSYLKGEGLEPAQAQRLAALLSPSGRGFLSAAERMERRRQRQRHAVVASLSVAFCLVCGLAAFTFRQYLLAERRLRDATAASDRIVTAIEEKLFSIAGAEEVGRDLLQQVSLLLDKLLEGAPDDSPALRCRSVVYYRSAELARSHGDLSRARLESASAVATAERLVAKHPDSTAAIETLVASYIQSGDQEKFEWRWDAARRAYESALSVQQKLLVGNASVPEYHYHQSICQDGLGDIALAEGHIDEAAVAYEASHHLQEALLGDDRGNPRYRFSYSVNLYRLGDIHLKRGDIVRAREFFQRSEAMQRTLFDEGHRHPEYRRTLSGIEVRLGDTFLLLDDPRAAHSYYEQAQKLAEILVESEPEDMKYLKALLKASFRLAQSDRQAGHCEHFEAHRAAAVMLRNRIHKQAASLIDPQIQELSSEVARLQEGGCP